MPARDLWARIQKQLQGRAEDEQLRLLQSHLDELHEEWKGPYKELRDRLRRRVARLQGHASVRSRAGHEDPFHVRRQGDAQIAVCGSPNTGKSTLVQAWTGAATVVAGYPFATQHPVPGMLSCPGGALQLVDTPPLVPGLARGEGGGRPFLHLLSRMDALALVIDLTGSVEAQVEVLLSQLAEVGVRPVPGPVTTLYRAKAKEGVRFRGLDLSRSEEAAARRILRQAGREHAEVTVRGAFAEDELAAQAAGESLTPAVLLGTRSREPGAESAAARLRELQPGFRVVAVGPDPAAARPAAVQALLAALGLVTVSLLDRPRPEADAEELLVPLASEVGAIARRLHGRPPKEARLWGRSADRPGQVVGLGHLVQAGDRIYLRT